MEVFCAIWENNILQYLTQKLKVQHVNLHSTLLSLDNNDNVDGKFIAEFDIIKAMIGVDEELLMDSLNYIDENFHLISYNLLLSPD